MDFTFYNHDNIKRYYMNPCNSILISEERKIKDKTEIINMASEGYYNLEFERVTIDTVFIHDKLITPSLILIFNKILELFNSDLMDIKYLVSKFLNTLVDEKSINYFSKSLAGCRIDIIQGKLEMYKPEYVINYINYCNEAITEITEYIDRYEGILQDNNTKFFKFLNKYKELDKYCIKSIKELGIFKEYLISLVEILNKDIVKLNGHLRRDFEDYIKD